MILFLRNLPEQSGCVVSPQPGVMPSAGSRSECPYLPFRDEPTTLQPTNIKIGPYGPELIWHFG